MRWKLITLSSIIVALVFVIVWFILTYFGLQLSIFPGTNLFFWQTITFIIGAVINATFVYRHTAKRRKTQVFVSLFLTLFLILTFVYFLESSKI